jgi:hypothetical protein
LLFPPFFATAFQRTYELRNFRREHSSAKSVDIDPPVPVEVARFRSDETHPAHPAEIDPQGHAGSCERIHQWRLSKPFTDAQQNPLTMVKIRQLLRLHAQGKSKHQIANQTGVTQNTLKKYLKAPRKYAFLAFC